ncbi:hypothetical protein ACUTQ5_13705 [Serratia sp. NA_112.1]|uniref:hypothetical protein n=1 Tax=unclassified Serratia (in: enterobacteria) TaxID=2647522 RepID=UPI004046EE8E
MKIKTKSSVFLLIMVGLLLGYLGWKSVGQELDGGFECQARIHTRMAANTCQGDSITELFLAMHGNGKGYVVVSGSYTCPNAQPQLVERIVEFTYKKEGSYYAVRFGARNPDLAVIFKLFRYDEVKFKIIPLGGQEYLLSSPWQTPMVCKRE